ncbi:MAG TPA: chemotaxis protein CheA [Anaeromyxobacter sp.]|nr:chemotaxis protein CheA [Anaeromyxobacter sp.]
MSAPDKRAQSTPRPAEERPAPPATTDPPGPSSRADPAPLAARTALFANEADEGLERLERFLLNAERDGADPDGFASQAAALQAIRSGAAALGMEGLAEVAHAFEGLLSRCRQGTLALEGGVTDLAFDAAAMLRRALSRIRAAAEQGRAAELPSEIGTLADVLRLAAEGFPPPERDLPPAAVGQRLGEILTGPAGILTAEQVEHAAEIQAQTGRRLGEEIVAQKLAAPGTVARALRAQLRASRDLSREEAVGSRQRETVKVDFDRVDGLVEVIGELVVVQTMMKQVPELSGLNLSERARSCLTQLAKVTRDLQDVGNRLRMVPVEPLFQRMARLARDLSRHNERSVRIVTEGEWTEVDRVMIEHLADPMVHMIRNAVDHGLEPAEDRVRAGKPAHGTIRLAARRQGHDVVVEVSDDGRGLHRDRIAAKAVERGIIPSADGLSDGEVHALIFAPGFSTAETVSEISGRGVGMNVVRRSIEALRGRVELSTVPGQGTTFRIVLPLTLAIIDGMQVSLGGERFIVPTLSILESLRPEPYMVRTMAGSEEILHLRGRVLPLLRLSKVLGVEGAKSQVSEALVVIVESAGRRFGLLVDEVLAQAQVVIKALGEGLRDSVHFSGAAILGDGRVGLILSVDALARELYGKRAQDAAPPSAPAAAS